MAEWKVPSTEEEAELRELGLNPDHIVVNRVGVDARVYLNMRSREEIFVSSPCGSAEKFYRPGRRYSPAALAAALEDFVSEDGC